MHAHFESNAVGRDFVIGDLHGHPEFLARLLKEVEFDEKTDRVFSTGDLIDRGPDSIGALAYLQQPWFFAVRGNHEQLLIDSIIHGADMGCWLSNGGKWAFETRDGFLRAAAETLQSLPLSISVGEGDQRFNVIHAEFFGNDAELEASENSVMLQWGRSLVMGTPPKHVGLSRTFCGHSAVKNPIRLGQQIFIDTGSGHRNGGLTIVEALSGRTWTVRDEEHVQA